MAVAGTAPPQERGPERERRRAEWNEPVLWPLALAVVALAVLPVPALLSYRRRERGTATPGERP